MEHRLLVIGHDGIANELRLEAETQAQAARMANGRGLRVVSVLAGDSAPSRGLADRGFDLLLFSQELVALLQAGLHVNAALQALAAKERAPATKALLDGLVGELVEGRSLSDCLARRPTQFPQVYVAGVRANEQSGGLVQSLERFVAYQSQLDALKRKVVSASIYPGLLMSVGLFVALFLMGYVVPKFSAVYDSAGRDLPWLSTALLQVGGWINANLTLFVLAVIVMVSFSIFALMQPPLRTRILIRATSLPGVRERARLFRLGRLYRTIGLLVLSGIPLARAMLMAKDSLVGAESDALARVRRALDEGRLLSDALSAEGLSTPIADSLIRVGETSGRLGDMLERTAQFHDDEFSRWIDAATRLVEPLLMVAIGLVIGTIVVLMYLPIFELAGSLR